jgi:hypothetical protein
VRRSVCLFRLAADRVFAIWSAGQLCKSPDTITSVKRVKRAETANPGKSESTVLSVEAALLERRRIGVSA